MALAIIRCPHFFSHSSEPGTCGIVSGCGTRRRQQSLPPDFTHLQPPSIGQHHPSFTAASAKNLLYLPEIHDRRTVDTNELTRVQRLRKLFDCLAKHQALRTHVQARVIIGGFNPFDIVHVDYGIFGPVGYDNSLEILFLLPNFIAQRRQQQLEFPPAPRGRSAR